MFELTVTTVSCFFAVGIMHIHHRSAYGNSVPTFLLKLTCLSCKDLPQNTSETSFGKNQEVRCVRYLFLGKFSWAVENFLLAEQKKTAKNKKQSFCPKKAGGVQSGSGRLMEETSPPPPAKWSTYLK